MAYIGSLPEEGFSLIITQIGRENNISAEICLLRVAEDVYPYKCCVKHPYEKKPNSGSFFIFLILLILPSTEVVGLRLPQAVK